MAEGPRPSGPSKSPRRGSSAWVWESMRLPPVRPAEEALLPPARYGDLSRDAGARH